VSSLNSLQKTGNVSVAPLDGFIVLSNGSAHCSGFSTFSTRITPLRRMSSSVVLMLGGTTPGQSIK
jgi:hypothetical protein